jgi:hypothetical protein
VLLASSTDGAAPAQEASRPVAGPDGFRGRVLDADGAPVARANVTLIDRMGRQAGLTVTDEAGRYSLAAPSSGTFVLAASASGYAPRACPATYPANGLPAEADLVLTVSAPERRTAVPS